MQSKKLRAASAQAAGDINYNNWTEVNSTATFVNSASISQYKPVAYSSSVGVYAAINTAAIFSSTDGASWVQRLVVCSSPSSSYSLFSVIWTGTKFITALGGTDTVATDGSPTTVESTDGVNWVCQLPNYRAAGVNGVGAVTVYASWLTKYLEFCVSACSLSNDGVTSISSKFLLDPLTQQNVRPCAAFADATSQKIVMTGTFITQNGTASSTTGLICTSSDGVNWSYLASQTAVFAVVSNGTTWVTAGSSGAISTSTDGLIWTARTSGTTNKLAGLTWTGSLFVAVGASGVILTSPDGVTWTSRSSGTTQTLNSVTWVGGLAVAVGNAGAITTSPDGVTWTARTSGVTNILYSVHGNGTVFVVVGAAGVGVSCPLKALSTAGLPEMPPALWRLIMSDYS